LSSEPFSEIQEKAKQYLEAMKPEDIAYRLALLEWKLERIDSFTRYIIENIGQFFRGVRRDYIPIDGVLIGCKFNIDDFEVWVEERRKEWGSTQVIHEMKIVKLPAKSLLYYEVIPFRETYEETATPTTPEQAQQT